MTWPADRGWRCTVDGLVIAHMATRAEACALIDRHLMREPGLCFIVAEASGERWMRRAYMTWIEIPKEVRAAPAKATPSKSWQPERKRAPAPEEPRRLRPWRADVDGPP